MVELVCKVRIRDKFGNIVGYKLVGDGGLENTIEADVLKALIRNKQIAVNNLILTRDNRLVMSRDKDDRVDMIKISLDLSSFNIGSICDVKNMIIRCKSLQYIDLYNWTMEDVGRFYRDNRDIRNEFYWDNEGHRLVRKCVDE